MPFQELVESTLPDPAAQAWAMRDAFDGLIDVLVRKKTRAP